MPPVSFYHLSSKRFKGCYDVNCKRPREKNIDAQHSSRDGRQASKIRIDWKVAVVVVYIRQVCNPNPNPLLKSAFRCIRSCVRTELKHTLQNPRNLLPARRRENGKPLKMSGESPPNEKLQTLSGLDGRPLLVGRITSRCFSLAFALGLGG